MIAVSLFLGCFAGLPTISAGSGGPKSTPRRATTRNGRKEVAAYEAADRQSPPPKGGILFIGSSTIRLWKTLAEDFPNHKVINRGFGGTEIVDSTHFADRLIFRTSPSRSSSGRGQRHSRRADPEGSGARLLGVRPRGPRRLPKTEILYISVSPAPSRWGEIDKYRELNRLIRTMALDMPRVGFIDAFDIVLGPKGSARPELFVKDRLHFAPEGYKLMTERVRPFLAK